MSTMAEISAAINQINTKKQNLYKSFLHLQSQSPSSFTLPLNWAEIDSYFTTLHSSLHSKFNLLQTLHPSPNPTTVLTRPELKSLCQNSDGFGLTRFISLAPVSDRLAILSELPDAYRFAPDAPKMVSDAVVGFYSTEMGLFRSGCLIMLEGLIGLDSVISVEVKDKAMEVAVEWNEKRVCGFGNVKGREEDALGFLLLVGAYGIVDRFGIDDVIDCFVDVATDGCAVDLCRRIVPESNVNDMIKKLIDKDMHVTAVNFSIGLHKTDEFSPVGLLEERKLRSLRVIEEARTNVKDLRVSNEVTMKEIDTLKSIIKCIEENHLQSEYSKDSVVELVNKLENEVENSKQTLMNDLRSRKQPARATVSKNQLRSRKQPARATVSKNQLRLRKQPLRVAALKNQPLLRKQPTRAAVLKNQLRAKSKMKLKRPKLNNCQPAAESAAAATAIQNIKLVQESQSHSQKSDLSPDHVGEYHNSSRGSGPTGSNAPYANLVMKPVFTSCSTRADTGYNFFVQQLQPFSDCNSNGWISE